jgi:hypothetical protein
VKSWKKGLIDGIILQMLRLLVCQKGYICWWARLACGNMLLAK